MKPGDKKHYVIPSEYNERGNPQNQNFLMDAHVSPLGFLCMTLVVITPLPSLTALPHTGGEP